MRCQVSLLSVIGTCYDNIQPRGRMMMIHALTCSVFIEHLLVRNSKFGSYVCKVCVCCYLIL